MKLLSVSITYFFSDDKVVNQTNIQFATLQMLLLFEKKGLTS